MLLALNRLFDLLKPQWMETLFGGNKTYVWLLVPICYGTYFVLFTSPLIYTSVYNAAFFDPFTATDKADAELVIYIFFDNIVITNFSTRTGLTLQTTS